MKELVKERLNKLPDLEERKLLRDIVNEAFLGVVDYNEAMLGKLREEIFEEIKYNESLYTIVTTITARKDLDPIHESLYPMLLTDYASTETNAVSIVKAQEAGEEIIIDQLYMECDYLILKKALEDERIYKGFILTEGKKYEIQIKIKQNKEYQQCIEKLYEKFILNNIAWTTVNAPYVSKFINVVLVSCEEKLKKDDVITSVEVDLEEYNDYKKRDIVPLWNVEPIVMKDQSFPVAAMDNINYVHEIAFSSLDKESGYLVILNDDFDGYIHRSTKVISVIAKVEQISDWQIWRIADYKESKLDGPISQVMSNKMINNFANRFATVQSKNIRTKAELIRRIQSFEVSKSLDFNGFSVQEKYENQRETYDCDFFLSDGIRLEKFKKILMLEFVPSEKINYITRDIMSFLVSELQQYFPEYLCLGQIKK